MSEEQEHEGTWSGLKKTILGTLATVVTAGGAWLGSMLFGGGSEATPAVAAPAPVINITNTNQQQQQAAPGKTVIINQAPAAKEKPVAPKKKTEKEQLEEAPAW
jgi:hypothetical protein